MKTLALSLSLLAFAGAAVAADSPQLSADERRVLETSPGVVYIQVWYTGIIDLPGIPRQETRPIILSGTGFLYRPDGYLITNSHVVVESNIKDPIGRELRMNRVYSAGLKWIQDNLMHGGEMSKKQAAEFVRFIDSSQPHLEVYLSNHRQYTGEIKLSSDPSFINNGKDVAIVKIDGNNLPTVKLGNSEEVHVGEPVEVIGYPGVAMNSDMISKQSELVPSVTNGHLSAVKFDIKGTPVLQSDVAITHGNSGGPAFDPDGKAVGIATYTNEKEVAGFNFLVPINTALEFVRQVGAEPQSGEFDKTWESALDAFQQGHWATAHRLFGDILAMMPEQPDAVRLENVAAHNERNETPFDRVRRGGGAYLWPVVGIVVVLVLALIVWRMAASRKPALATAGGPPVPPPHFTSAPPPVVPPPVGPPKASSLPPLGPTRSPLPPPPDPSAPTFGTLQVTGGALNGNRFPVPKAGVLIGRDSSKCNIVISDDTVSKEHAWVVPVDDEVVIIDRGSSNGTFLNSADSPRINKVALKNGDRIFIGKKGVAVLTYFS